MFVIMILILSLVLSLSVYLFNSYMAFIILLFGGAMLIWSLETRLSEEFFEVHLLSTFLYTGLIILLSIIYSANALFVVYHIVFQFAFAFDYHINKNRHREYIEIENEDKTDEEDDVSKITILDKDKPFSFFEAAFEDISKPDVFHTDPLVKHKVIDEQIGMVKEKIFSNIEELTGIGYEEKTTNRLPFSAEGTMETLLSEREAFNESIRKLEAAKNYYLSEALKSDEEVSELNEFIGELEEYMDKLTVSEAELDEVIEEKERVIEEKEKLSEELEEAKQALDKHYKKERINRKKDWLSRFNKLLFEPGVFSRDIKRYKNPADIRKIEDALVQLNFSKDPASLSLGLLHEQGKNSSHHMGVKLGHKVAGRIEYQIINNSQKPVSIISIYDHASSEEYK